MSNTLRDQVIAAQAARNDALRRMHRAVELYQGAQERIAELEQQLATLRTEIAEGRQQPSYDGGQWFAENQSLVDDPQRSHKQN